MATLIKRYANRKLYNTATSRYITLKGVGELLDRGDEVRVVDNETGEDITQIALSQILVDNQRSREDPSETLLSQILTRGGDAVYSAIRRSVDDATDGLGEFQERFRQFVQRADARSAGGADETPRHAGHDPGRHAGPHPGPHGHTGGHSAGHAGGHRDGSSAGTAGHSSGHTAGHASGHGASPGSSEGATTDVGSLIRDAVARAFGGRDWPSRAEVERLNRNLERVATSLERLEATLAQSRPRSG
ncbi:MAG: polyhydroxyalkanoate synthesis regulator DNA-binding domain-containing protein [Myxococcota bacterium]